MGQSHSHDRHHGHHGPKGRQQHAEEDECVERELEPVSPPPPPPPLPKDLYGVIVGFCDARTLMHSCWSVNKAVHALCWAAARKRLFVTSMTGNMMGQLVFRDVWTGELVGTLAAHKASESCFQVVTIDGEDQLVTCGEDKQIRVWRLPSMKRLRERKMEEGIRCFHVDAANNAIALGVDDQIRLLPFDCFHRTGNAFVPAVLKEYMLSQIWKVRLLPTGVVLAMGGYQLFYFDSQGHYLKDVTTNAFRFHGSFLEILPGDPSKIVAVMDKMVRVCDSGTGVVLCEWRHHCGYVYSFCLTPQLRVLLACGKKNDFRVSEFTLDGQLVRHFANFYGARVLGFGRDCTILGGHCGGDFSTDVLQCREGDRVLWSHDSGEPTELIQMLLPK